MKNDVKRQYTIIMPKSDLSFSGRAIFLAARSHCSADEPTHKQGACLTADIVAIAQLY